MKVGSWKDFLCLGCDVDSLMIRHVIFIPRLVNLQFSVFNGAIASYVFEGGKDLGTSLR